MKRAERVPFKLINMECCSHLLCWINPRFPTYCPECGKCCYPAVRGWATHNDSAAILSVNMEIMELVKQDELLKTALVEVRQVDLPLTSEKHYGVWVRDSLDGKWIQVEHFHGLSSQFPDVEANKLAWELAKSPDEIKHYIEMAKN